ncbi:hypothetical protein EBR66_00215 [bacterium]|nr:hypothetical protein [bacterium]
MNRKSRLFLDATLIVVGIACAFFIGSSDFGEHLGALDTLQLYVGSFVAGIFFTSFITIAPASVAFAELAPHASTLEISFFGALGAVIGDLTIFLFIRDRLVEDVMHFILIPQGKRWRALLRRKHLRYLMAFLGALIVASPLPDEIGLAMMGISRMKTSLLVPIAFVTNYIGIAALITLVHAIAA